MTDTLPGAESRGRLEALFAERNAHIRNAERLHERLTRAAELAKAEAEPSVALAALSAQEDDAMMKYISGEGPEPVPDTNYRAKLETDLAKAKALAASARSAQTTIGVEIARETQAAEKVAASANVAIAQIVIAEFDELLTEFGAERERFLAAAGKLEAAYSVIGELGRSTPGEDDQRAILRHLPDVGARTNAALAPPDKAASDRAARAVWSTLISRLAAGDLSATLNWAVHEPALARDGQGNQPGAGRALTLRPCGRVSALRGQDPPPARRA